MSCYVTLLNVGINGGNSGVRAAVWDLGVRFLMLENPVKT